MENERYKPLFDKWFYWIFIPIFLLLLVATVLAAFEPVALFTMIPVDLFTLYFFVSPFFAYVELREKTLFIKYGFFLKREIPYESIRELKKDRRFYSESMLAIKNSMDHVNIKYNRFDVTSVSVVGNDGFVEKLTARISENRT